MISPDTAKLFRSALQLLIAEARNSYNSQNIANFSFTTTVSGRTTGDLSVNFAFSDSAYGYNETKSHNPVAALEEVLRRHGWAKENQSLLLSYSGDVKIETEE